MTIGPLKEAGVPVYLDPKQRETEMRIANPRLVDITWNDVLAYIESGVELPVFPHDGVTRALENLVEHEGLVTPFKVMWANNRDLPGVYIDIPSASKDGIDKILQTIVRDDAERTKKQKQKNVSPQRDLGNRE